MMHWLTIFLLVVGATLAISEHNALWCVVPFILAFINQLAAVWVSVSPEEVPYEQ